MARGKLLVRCAEIVGSWVSEGQRVCDRLIACDLVRCDGLEDVLRECRRCYEVQYEAERDSCMPGTSGPQHFAR